MIVIEFMSNGSLDNYLKVSVVDVIAIAGRGRGMFAIHSGCVCGGGDSAGVVFARGGVVSATKGHFGEVKSSNFSPGVPAVFF